MLIGIDSSRAVSPAPTGTEIYSRELIRALLGIDRENIYRLYTRERVADDFFGVSSNLEIRTIPFPRLWTHLRLSLEMLTRPPDVLFVPAHVLPLIHPRRSLVTIHDLGHLHFPQAYPPGQRLYHNGSTSWNARAAAHILADSEATRDDLERFYRVASKKTSVVYPGYDERLYRPVRDAAAVADVQVRLGIGGDYILTIGTIHPRKNYVRLIEAFGRLTNADCHLIIVGKRGWLYDAVFSRVEELRLDTRVHFLDYVLASNMPALITGARLLVFPSLHEGFGLPVLEGQACGTPVVCSMTSSFSEVAGDGALFFDPRDVHSIRGAIERVLGDGELRDRLIAHGFANVKRFSWDKSARQVHEILTRL